MVPDTARIVLITLAEASLRATAAAGVIAGILWMLRVHSSRARHTAWTIATCGMLLMPVLPLALPAIPVPIPAAADLPQTVVPILVVDSGAQFRPLTTSLADVDETTPSVAPARPAMLSSDSAPAGHAMSLSWLAIVFVIYGAGVSVTGLRLVAGWYASTRVVRRARPAGLLHDPRILESAALSTPAAVGVLAPRIILPSTWRAWAPETLQAVLAHEAAHLRRRDPLVAFLSRLNRCVFWFHPLSWWLTTTLATFAEYACDDEAARDREPRGYAHVLLDMARAAHHGGRRISWSVVRIDGGGVERRIRRLLAPTAVPATTTLRRCAGTLASVAVVVAVAACGRSTSPSPALKPDPLYAEQLSRRAREWQASKQRDRVQTTSADIAALREAWAKHPGDLDALAKILRWHYINFSGTPDPNAQWIVETRRPYILWLIEHHPEHPLAGGWSARIVNTRSHPFADPVGYAAAKALWLAHAKKPDVSVAVLYHAAAFFESNDKALAEQLLLRAHVREPSARSSMGLGRLYALMALGANAAPWNAILSVSVDDANGESGRHGQEMLDRSTDATLLLAAGEQLVNSRRFVEGLKTRMGVDPVALGKRHLARAAEIDPRLEGPREILGVSAFNERIRPLLRLDRARLANASVSDRLVLLSYRAMESYVNAEYEAYAMRPRAEMVGRVWAESEQDARDALALAAAHRDDPEAGPAIYSANITLALHTLRKGDRAGSVAYMKKAAAAPSSSASLYVGVRRDDHSRLMRYLLKVGERDSVVTFLEQSAVVMPARKDEFLRDASAVRAGVMPQSFQSMIAREQQKRVSSRVPRGFRVAISATSYSGTDLSSPR